MGCKGTSAALVLALCLCPGVSRAYEFDPHLWQAVVLTEVMVAPKGVEPGAGQWIEITNQGQEPVNLQGMVLATLGGGMHVLSPTKALVLGPGESLVAARGGDPRYNGGVQVDYVYGGEVLLSGQQDVVFLLKGGALVDLFAYGPDSIQVKKGATFSLEPPALGFTWEKQWCHGRLPYGYGDNTGTPGQPNTFCDGDGDGLAEDQGDCDDSEPSVHPGAVESCNGLDDDCNGSVDDGVSSDLECRSLGVCNGVEPVCGGAKGFYCPYPERFEEVEATCDGLDNDCDGLTDEDLEPPFQCRSLGVCKGAVLDCAGEAGFRCTYPSTFELDEVTCDGLDNDCDGETDEGFGIGEDCVEGLGECARHGQAICSPDGKGPVCSASAATPGVERCGDGKDNDCDGETDEGFAINTSCTAGRGVCKAVGKIRCAPDGLSVECSAVPGEPGAEVCGDGLDNDCDGLTDEDECSQASGGCSAGGTPNGHRTLSWLLAALVLLWSRRRLSREPVGPAHHR